MKPENETAIKLAHSWFKFYEKNWIAFMKMLLKDTNLEHILQTAWVAFQQEKLIEPWSDMNPFEYLEYEEKAKRAIGKKAAQDDLFIDGLIRMQRMFKYFRDADKNKKAAV